MSLPLAIRRGPPPIHSACHAGQTANGIAAILAVSVWHTPGHDQSARFTPILPDFSGVAKDQDWAKILGNTLFWGEKLGSDGIACASCHFNAGADPKIKNQLGPGLLEVTLMAACLTVAICSASRTGSPPLLIDTSLN